MLPENRKLIALSIGMVVLRLSILQLPQMRKEHWA